MASLVFCFVDIETDGPHFPASSMLGFACAAYDESGLPVDTFERHLLPLPGTAPAAETADWWRTQPDAWRHITSDQRPAEEVMPEFLRWLQSLNGDPVLAAAPLMFDGLWLDHYLQRFTTARAFGLHGTSPFVGPGIDVPTFVQASLGRPYSRMKPDYGPELLGGNVHSHKPLDDARAYAALYFNSRRLAAIARGEI